MYYESPFVMEMFAFVQKSLPFGQLNMCEVMFYEDPDYRGWTSYTDDSIDQKAPIVEMTITTDPRRCLFRNRDDQKTVVYNVNHGDLVVMQPGSQLLYERLYPIETFKSNHIRVALTFYSVKI